MMPRIWKSQSREGSALATVDEDLRRAAAAEGVPENAAWPRFDAKSEVLSLSNPGGVTSDFAVRRNCGPLEQSGLVSWEWK